MNRKDAWRRIERLEQGLPRATSRRERVPPPPAQPPSLEELLALVEADETVFAAAWARGAFHPANKDLSKLSLDIWRRLVFRLAKLSERQKPPYKGKPPSELNPVEFAQAHRQYRLSKEELAQVPLGVKIAALRSPDRWR
jgi:hypothetical protein